MWRVSSMVGHINILLKEIIRMLVTRQIMPVAANIIEDIGRVLRS